MNDHLQNALEQLKCRASGGWEPLHLLPKEAQALLDERDTLRKALRGLLCTLDEHGYGWPGRIIGNACAEAHAAFAKTRNEET